jgi:uncharacterized membrane protein
MSTPSFLEIALRTQAAGLFALGCAGVFAMDFLPGLQPVGALGGSRAPLAAAHGLALAALALAWTCKRTRVWAGLTLAVFLMSWAAFALLPQVIAKPQNTAARVAAVETVALACVAWAIACRTHLPWAPGAARAAFVLLLLVFGIAHLMHREAIASMIPPWMPARAHWPWLTGSALLAAAIALATGVRAQLAACCVGSMFLAWLPLVHFGRLLERPTSLAEWTFAAMALALAGAALCVAALSPRVVTRGVSGAHA